MFNALGGFFGWLLVVAFIGTILNYVVKYINKKFGKKLSEKPMGKQIMKNLMTIFVRNHKYFGFATGTLLIIHFIIQFSKYGLNLTGAIAGILLILQIPLGIYGVKKKQRKGLWFISHRLIAVLLIVGIFIHIMFPYMFNTLPDGENSSQVTETIDSSELPTFTLEELSEYNGKDGNKAYVVYKGFVYDMTNVAAWKNGEHNGQSAGTDITEFISKSPHGDSVFEKLEIVGKLEQ